jgi:hypothetical protein
LRRFAGVSEAEAHSRNPERSRRIATLKSQKEKTNFVSMKAFYLSPGSKLLHYVDSTTALPGSAP